MAMDPVRIPEEFTERHFQHEGSLTESTGSMPMFFDEPDLWPQPSMMQKRFHSKYLHDGSFEYEYDSSEETIPLVGLKARPGEKTYRCPVCGENFSAQEYMIKHQMNHTISEYVTDPQRVPVFMNSGIPAHAQRTHTEEALCKCNECEKKFSNSYKLRIHQRIHTGERPYKCPQCDKMFIKDSHLKVHVRSHTGERPYKCKLCGKGFTKSYHLKIHVMTHTGEKPHKCLECGKSFTVNSRLTAHQRTHAGEKPYFSGPRVRGSSKRRQSFKSLYKFNHFK